MGNARARKVPAQLVEDEDYQLRYERVAGIEPAPQTWKVRMQTTTPHPLAVTADGTCDPDGSYDKRYRTWPPP